MKKIINALACYIKKAWKQLFVLLSLLIVSTSCIAIANGIQTGFGSIKVESGYIETNILNSEETVNIGIYCNRYSLTGSGNACLAGCRAKIWRAVRNGQYE